MNDKNTTEKPYMQFYTANLLQSISFSLKNIFDPLRGIQKKERASYIPALNESNKSNESNTLRFYFSLSLNNSSVTGRTG